jgi:hypothetical protein
LTPRGGSQQNLGTVSQFGRLVLLLSVAVAPLGCDGFKYETYVAELDGALEGVSTPARGRAIVLVSRRGERAEITLSISGVQGPVTGSYVRLAPRGQTGQPVYTLWLPGQGPFDNDSPILRVWERGASPRSTPPGADAPRGATATPFDDSMLQALRAGDLYVNVQTQQRPSGEVRGQLLPE